MSYGRIVIHLSGPDRPGITSSLTEIIAAEEGKLIDIGQSVLMGFLTLSAIVELPAGSDALRKILFMVSREGLRLEVEAFTGDRIKDESIEAPALCVTMLGTLDDGKAIARATRYFAEHKMNICGMTTLTEGDLRGIEFFAELPRGGSKDSVLKVRGDILKLAGELGIDLAVQKDDIFRRSRRLVCMDVDSTFVQIEVIDELAKIAGSGENVAKITEAAMRGELDFKQSLTERVATLKGLPFEKARQVLNDVPMTPGAEKLVRTLKTLGLKVGLVSGGFDFFVDELKRRFDLDFTFANRLEVIDGKLTGKVLGTIVDAERKAQLLRDMTHVYECRPEQTVAIGDGANDMLMLQSAGLGIAYHAKSRLQGVADLSLNQSYLEAVLYLMGLRAHELRQVLALT